MQAPAPLTDAHCHLQAPELLGQLEAVIARAEAAGVQRMLSCGTRPEDWSPLEGVAAAHSAVTPCFGLHPWYADEEGGWLPDLRKRLIAHPSAGVGEIGLDGKLTPVPMERQRRVFRQQLSLAEELGRPCMLHCVHAWGPLLEDVEAAALSVPFLLHAYGGSAEMVPRFAELGGYFSFGGSVVAHASKRLRAALEAVPEDRLLLETDSPALHPDGKDRINEPENLLRILDAVAMWRGQASAVLRRSVDENGLRFLSGAGRD